MFLVLFLFAVHHLYAQKMTIILLRHAEKDISATANKADPDLTPAGRQRALRLVETVGKCKPDHIFSTVFRRSMFTATPLAESLHSTYRLKIESYDYNELDDFAAGLLKLQAGCVVVVGHNTTTPMLANILVKQDKYKSLDDAEYNKIWIIEIHGKRIIDRVIEY